MASATALDLTAIVNTVVLLAEQDYAQACDRLDQHLNALRQDVSALNNLGLMFYRQVHYDLACRCFYFLLELDPQQYRTHNNLGLTLNRFGWGEKAVEHYRQALAIKPDYHPARSNLAYALHYFGETGRPEIKAAHAAIATHVFAESRNYLPSRPNRTHKQGNEPLKIGYVSSDFRNHAVGRFIAGILEQHDRTQFAVYVFDNRANNNDPLAQQLKSLEVQWHDIADLGTEDVCQLIVKLDIDVLIDLSGHTSGGRADVFSQRVAPVQITYLGYPNTSGLPTMDFRIGDVVADPVEFTEQNCERMLRLPHAMWNYQPWPDMPACSPSPFLRHKHVTLGSANNHAKIQREWLAVWAEILQAAPDAVFKIKSRALKNPALAAEFLDFFSNKGIGPERITIEHYSATRAEHWRSLSEFDIALDTFPYNGTTTTCDLLWLGVPVATRLGQSHVSRTSASILKEVGLAQWVAKTDQEFIDLVVEKCHAEHELQKLRQSLRVRMQNSHLNHTPLFMVAYERLLQEAYAQMVPPFT